MMKARFEISRAESRRFLVALGVLVLSAYGSCREAKFRLRGKEAKGRVTAITVDTQDSSKYDVHYRYWDPESRRKRAGWTPVPRAVGNRFEVGQEVMIEYLDAESLASRIRGVERTYWPYVFFLSLAFVVFEIVRFLHR